MSNLKSNDRALQPNPAFRKGMSDWFNLDRFFDNPLSDSFNWANWKSSVPAANIKETDKSWIIELAAPGLEKSDFQIETNRNTLLVKAQAEIEEEHSVDDYTRREYSFQNFQRTFSLPETGLVDKIKAKYKGGVLRIELPRKAGKKNGKSVRQVSIA